MPNPKRRKKKEKKDVEGVYYVFIGG